MLGAGCGVRVKVHDHGAVKTGGGAGLLIDLFGVREYEGLRVEGVRVRIRNVETGERCQVLTLAEKPVSIHDIPPGRYEFRVAGEPLGAGTMKKTVDLRGGRNYRVSVFDHTEDWAEGAGDVGEGVLYGLGIVGGAVLVGGVLWLSVVDTDDDDDDEF